MSKAPADHSCLVCGASDMARSHLFPRALIHEIRKGGKHVLAVPASGTRIGMFQSGEVSTRILCHQHEKATQRSDDAAVRLVRAVRKRGRLSAEGHILSIPNPRSDDLVRFIHATVWRHWAHWATAGGPEVAADDLAALGDVVFGDAAPLPTMIMAPARTHRGKPAEIALVPGLQHLDGVEFVRFEVGGLAFFLTLDRGPIPPQWTLFSASRQPDLQMLVLSKGELMLDQTIMHFVRNAPRA